MNKTKRPLRAVIMAGGSGTRFWPLSRRGRPKQFLPISGQKPMITETVERLLPLLPIKSIFTISDGPQARMVKKLVPGLPPGNILVEPQAKNTAASLILATARIYLRNPRAVVFALPADHLITRPDIFLRKLAAAAEAASKRDVIVTFGIPPTFPATGFGYIHYAGRKAARFRGEMFYPVLRFKEKPDTEQARKFLKQGWHSWNSGMFVWRADVFARQIEKWAPEFYPFWRRMVRALRRNDRAEIAAIFQDIPATSIDYALMERSRAVLMGQGNFGWSDVGSWSALAEIWPKDNAGNAGWGKAILVDSSNCLFYNPRKLSVLIGLKDVVVVDTGGALLVCHKGQDQKVKDVIEVLKKTGKGKYL